MCVCVQLFTHSSAHTHSAGTHHFNIIWNEWKTPRCIYFDSNYLSFRASDFVWIMQLPLVVVPEPCTIRKTKSFLFYSLCVSECVCRSSSSSIQFKAGKRRKNARILYLSLYLAQSRSSVLGAEMGDGKRGREGEKRFLCADKNGTQKILVGPFLFSLFSFAFRFCFLHERPNHIHIPNTHIFISSRMCVTNNNLSPECKWEKAIHHHIRFLCVKSTCTSSHTTCIYLWRVFLVRVRWNVNCDAIRMEHGLVGFSVFRLWIVLLCGAPTVHTLTVSVWPNCGGCNLGIWSHTHVNVGVGPTANPRNT